MPNVHLAHSQVTAVWDWTLGRPVKGQKGKIQGERPFLFSKRDIDIYLDPIILPLQMPDCTDSFQTPLQNYQALICRWYVDNRRRDSRTCFDENKLWDQTCASKFCLQAGLGQSIPGNFVSHWGKLRSKSPMPLGLQTVAMPSPWLQQLDIRPVLVGRPTKQTPKE